MAELKLAPYVTLEQTGTGEVLANVLTTMGSFVATLGLSNIFATVERSDANGFGSKVYGFGCVNQGDAGGVSKIDKLYFYFYHTEGSGTLDSKGLLPDFVSRMLDIDESKIVAYTADATVVNSEKPKQGIQEKAEGLYTTLAPVVGCTCYWPQGYGTGEINAMCVSLVDLTTLKTTQPEKAIYAGISYFNLPNSYTSFIGDCVYIKPSVPGITGEKEILVVEGGKLWLHNLLTGTKTAYTKEFPNKYYMGIWGSNQFLIGDKLYLITSKGSTSSYAYVYELDLTAKTQTEIVRLNSYAYGFQLMYIDGDLWVTKSTSYSAITLEKIDIQGKNLTGVTKIITMPAYFPTNSIEGKITQFDDGDYGVINPKSGVCHKFSNLDDIEGSVTDAFFTGAKEFQVAPIKVRGVYDFLCVTGSGYYNREYVAGLFKGLMYLSITCGDVGPVLTWNKFDTTYNKKENSELTSSFMLSVSALQ